MSFFAGKKIFLLGFLVVLLFAIPLTVFLTQKSQQVTSTAAPATTLTFVPSTKSINVGDSVSFDIMMNPGTNQVSFVKLTVSYDPTKFTVDQTSGFVANSVAFGTPLQGPTYGTTNVSVSLSVGSDPAKVITTTTKIATITLKAIAGTGGATTPIHVERAQTQVLSVGAADQANEDVLVGQPADATVTIGGSAASSGGSSSSNKVPVCSSLVLDRSATGPAPYSLTFTASGKDDDGTISKISFTFGDGKTGDVTTGGGIGTNTVNAQISHTYQNAGTFNASAVLTDNSNALSTTTCAATITVTAATSGGGGGSSSGGATGSGSAVIIPTETPIITVPPTITPTIAATGPGDKIIGIGTVGIIFSILGVLLLAL